MKDVLLRVSQARKSFGGTLALDGVSLEVRCGAIVGLLGANGAGKTTLIRIAMGLMKPDEGLVERVAATAGYLPEERGLYQRQRAGATLEYLARLKGLSAASESARCLEQVQMWDLRMKRIEHLSKGQQQKIQIAAALLGQPELLVLDEPFAGLDPLNARLVCDLTREAAAAGRGVLVSAHQLALVDDVCTHIVMLSHGRVVAAGAIEDVRGEHGVALEARFVELASTGGGG